MAVAALQQEPTAAGARSEAAVVVQQEPALAGSSQATTVEIPDDDAPPPGWDQWASLPTPAPEPQAGALVRRRDGHMVAGARGMAPSPLRPVLAPLHRARSALMRRPHFADAQEEQQLWEELRDHGASLNRVLNEVLRIHGGPIWRVFQVRRCSRVVPLACCFLLCSVVLTFVFAARC
jgi:hypothetical protein